MVPIHAADLSVMALYVAMANTDIQHAAIHQLLQLYMLYKRLYMLHALHYAACRVYNPYTVYIAIHCYTIRELV